MGFGYRELIVIFLIALLIFGGKKIPEIARGLGKGLKEFKKARDDIRDAIENEETEADLAGTASPEPKASDGGGANDRTES